MRVDNESIALKKENISKVSLIAFTQNDMDYIRVFFNTEVKAKAGEAIDVTISGFTMGASANKALVDQNNGLTYYEIAMAKDCEFLDLEQIAKVSEIDGLHYDESAHKQIADAFFDIISNLSR